MEAPKVKWMLSRSMSQVCHVGQKLIASPSTASTLAATSVSLLLPAPLCITPTLVEAASGVPLLVGNCYTLDWWDAEGRHCNRLGGTDVHGRHVLHDGRLVG